MSEGQVEARWVPSEPRPSNRHVRSTLSRMWWKEEAHSIFPQRWLQGAMDYFQKGDTLNTFITGNYVLSDRLTEDLEIGVVKKEQKWTKETTKLARSHKWYNKAIELEEI